MNIDEWFGKVRGKYAENMQCGKGCTACCYGLFDITLADAVEVARSFAGLPEGLKDRVDSRATALHSRLCDAVPDLDRPAILPEDDPRLDQLVDAFKQGVPDAALADLQQDYNRIDEFQEGRSAAVARKAGLPDHRAVTLIPSVIAEYESFWKQLI